MRRKSMLPADHPVMVLIAEAKAERKQREPKRSAFEWRTARECPGCACLFTPLYTPNAITCSLHEWAVVRESKGKPPRVTKWDSTDTRYSHLMYRQPVAA